MVFGTSVNPLDASYKHTINPYEAALAATANASTVHVRGFECSTPASPSRNSDSHAAPPPLIATTHHDRTASPTPSSDSAAGAASGTPPAERPALGRFSASFPQFTSHTMSPLDPVPASATYSDGTRGPAAGFTTMPSSCEQAATNSEQLMVTVHPEDLQTPEAPPAPAAVPPPEAAASFEEVRVPTPHHASLPPLPPSAATAAAAAGPHQHYAMAAPVSRPRHGSATTISYGPGGYPPPSPGDAAATPLGMSPSGAYPDHITRTASLPLLMCNAVLPPGASPAIPIAIAGVGACGRARATTIHTPLAGAGGSSGGGAGGAAACAACAAGAHRGVTQSTDHHFTQRHIASQAAPPPPPPPPFFHQSDGGGAAASSPAHFVGSISPSAGASFHAGAYFPFAGPSSGAAAATSGEEVGQQQSPDRRPADATAAAAAAASGGELEVDVDLMERGGGLTCSSREPRGPERGFPAAAAAAGAAAAAATATGRDTDGDEEFEDAVEVQHDDDDHVGFHDQMMLGGRSPGGPAAPPQGAGGGAHPHQRHRLQRCDYSVAAPYSPEATAAAAALARQPPGGSAGGAGAAAGAGDPQQQQQHSAPLPVMGAGGSGDVVVFRGRGGFEGEEGGYQVLDEGSYPRRRIAVEAEDEEVYGAADLEEDEDVFEGQEDEEVLYGQEEEDEEVLDEDEDHLAFGSGGGFAAVAAAAAAPPPPSYASPAFPMEQHICVNCTRPFWGAACRVCRQPADAEVVVPELLEGAVQSMLAGQAAAAAAAQQQQQQAQAAAAAVAHPGAAGGRGEGVLLAYDDRCRAHLEETSPGVSPDQGRSHPERPERVAAIMARLQGTGLLTRFLRTTGREATLAELVAVHDPELVSELEARTAEVARVAAQRAAARQAGGRAAGAGEDSDMGEEWFMQQRSAHVLDCYFCPATAACARLAAGSAAEVARRVVCGAARHGAAIIRPPGHHAESSVAMGFCYYNNAAVAARAAQAAGARRVVIMDWDVHHGNGTQRIFYDDPSVLYMSTHRYDGGNFYPGTGDASETGSGPGVGFTVNVPWNRSGVRDADMLAAFRHVIIPLATEFRPDLVIVSAGFDAAEGDPLGGCLISTAAFSHFAALLSALAPTVMLLEGGYNLTATAAATEACLRVLLGEPPAPLPDPLLQGGPAAGPLPDDPTTDPWVTAGLEGASDGALESVRLALRVQSQFWLAARENLAAVEAAIEERRQRHLMRLQQQPLQPREHWGWHVQMPAAAAAPPPPPSPPVHLPAASSGAAHHHPAAVVHQHPDIQLQREAMMAVEMAVHDHAPPPPPPPVEHFLQGDGADVGLDVVVVETRSGRRLDVSSSGVMELGEQGSGMLGGDVHMG
ncbi:hypothetical protein PLESTF_000595500 [Pleodorina starrii]|nr:hypothetical protein PLESTF_000595500 [Pleodorina starrii]